MEADGLVRTVRVHIAPAVKQFPERQNKKGTDCDV